MLDWAKQRETGEAFPHAYRLSPAIRQLSAEGTRRCGGRGDAKLESLFRESDAGRGHSGFSDEIGAILRSNAYNPIFGEARV